jgi:hypothetical protein
MSERLPYTGEAFGLLPCPFCDAHLVEVLMFSTRQSVHLTHPSDSVCVISHVNVLVSDSPENRARMDLWNTRGDVLTPTAHSGATLRAFLVATEKRP